MEKVDFTPQQKVIVEAFKKEPSLVKQFYLTGGTALSVFYLGHRRSEDLDFFSEEKFEPTKIVDLVQKWARVYNFEVAIRQVENVLIFRIKFENGGKTKVDFNYYPYKRVKKGKVTNGLVVDSLWDIAINKLLLVNQRTDVKDFVDLYFLKDKLTVWDLIRGVKVKFGFELDPILIAADFLKVEEFDFLPKMLVPLNISELSEYFKQKSKEVSESVTE